MYEIVIGRSESDKKKLGLKGTIFVGKHYVKMGAVTSLSNLVYIDVAQPHVILLTGKRGTGKCLAGDSLIQLADGSIRKIEDLREDTEVLGLNGELKITNLRKEGFYERTVDRLLKIRLRSGKEIKLTEEHPLLTIKGWKDAGTLTIGSRIATPRQISNFGNNNIEDYKIKLLAYLIAEGHTKKVVLFANNDPILIHEFEESLKSLDPNLELRKEKKDHYRITCPNWKNIVLDKSDIKFNKEKRCFDKGSKIILQKRTIRKLIEEYQLFNKLSIEKEIPEGIIRLKKEKLSLFLNRLFSCDGSIYPSHGSWEISYASSSEKLIRSVQNLLLRFGILSRLRNKKSSYNGKEFKSFELILTADNVSKFINEIGFFGRKKDREEQAVTHLDKTIRNTNIDTIPKEVWELYKPTNWTAIGKELMYAHPKAMRERTKYSPSRQTLMQIAIADQNKGLLTLAKSDIFWDEIVSIELLEGEFKVYDISVPEMHNFVANDIIVHNSYSLSVIAEEITMLPDEIKSKLAVLIIDTMGIFWTMKYPNVKEEDIIREWKLKPEGLDITIYTPTGYVEEQKLQGVPVDKSFTINPNELTAEEWCQVFNIDLFSSMGITIERALENLEGKQYSTQDIIEEIRKDNKIDDQTKLATENRFKAAEEWKIFDEHATPLDQIIKAGQVSVLDVSCYKEWSVKALVTGLVCKKLMQERMLTRKSEEVKDIERGHSYFSSSVESMGESKPLVWIMLDECLPYNSRINTNKGVIKIGDVVKQIEKGEKLEALSYNHKTGSYEYKPITKSYCIKPRELIKLTTESGNEFKCTNDHLVFGSEGYCSAISAKELATPLENNYDKEKKNVIARLCGHIWGDGYLSKRKIVGFCGKGDSGDLTKIKEDMAILGFTCSKVYERMTSSTITSLENKTIRVIGLSQEIKASWKAWEFFKERGLPIGKKTDSESRIPEWIMNGTVDEKAEFLAALMGSDGSGFTHTKNSKLDFNAGRLSFNKIEELKDEAWIIANQVRHLFNDLGIEISTIREERGNLRKDGKRTIKIRLTIAKSIDNTINFLERIGFKYNSKKERNGNAFLSYLKSYKNRLIEIQEEVKTVQRGKSEGKTLLEISEAMGLEYKRVRMLSKQVIKSKSTFKFESFEEWTSKRIHNNLLMEKIKKIELTPAEDLFDITVEDNHNFIAENILTHNCHEMLPREGKTPATDALVQLLREGRQPGISLVLATQQPGELNKDAITQSDIVISHRVTARKDIDALNSIMQTYLTADINSYLNNLPHSKGSAIVLDDNSEKIYPIKIRPKLSWHGGESPVAVKAKGSALEELKL